MGRRAKPKKGKAEAKARVPPRSQENDGARVQDLEKRLTEALARETATSEILRIISSSPADLQPVFDTILRSAVRLCRGTNGTVVRFDGQLIHLVAHDTPTVEGAEALHRIFPLRPGRDMATARAIFDHAVVHIPDADRDFSQAQRMAVQSIGVRSVLAVPMLKNGAAVGAIGVAKPALGGFSENEIALLKTFADQAVIAIENVRLFKELQEKNRALTEAHAQVTEALEQQIATSEILRVISSSPSHVQPVFDTIVKSAARLCNAAIAAVFRADGREVYHPANYGSDPEMLATVRARYPRPLDMQTIPGIAILTRSVVHVPDIEELSLSDHVRHVGGLLGFRSTVGVPMIRGGEAIGALLVARREVGRFSDSEVDLLKTFSDQAVIAIENVRLFTELQTSNRELTAALDTQTATSDILRVISRSQTDVQPVFDAIVHSAVRLLRAYAGTLTRVEGDQLELGAFTSIDDAADAAVRVLYPLPLTSTGEPARAVRERAPINIADAPDDPRVPEAGRALARVRGYRSIVSVPLLRDDQALGSLVVTRREPGRFTDDEVALLQTFADQAVIAIENARLLSELQASNRDLTTALDTQTATADILRVISSSLTDVQPVFDAIVRSAVRLLGGFSGALSRIAGDRIELVALTSTDEAGDASVRALFPQSSQSEGAHARAIRDRTPFNVADAPTDPRMSDAGRATARARGYRSFVAVPLVRHNEALGALTVSRREPGGFTDDEIALLQTFADQAVIAIENARLLTELQARTQELTRSVEQLTALGDVGRAVSSSLDLDTVLTTIVGRAVQLSGTDGGTIFEYDEGAEEFSARATLNADERQSALLRATRLRRGEGAVGQMAVTREAFQIPDIAAEGAYESRLRGALLEAGTRAVLAIPLLHEERIVGGLVVTRRTPGAFTTEIVEILRTFATQSALAIQNARLFREIERKSRELEVASQHKSEFLANMSHELRTPLNAIIGFSEVLSERMFGELNEKQDEYLKDIYASGQHLLSLINDILDLSKIEAGRMELELADFHLPSAVENALVLVRERASRRGIALGHTIDSGLGMVRADERKVKQVLLNLLSNALKFTPEGGRVDVRAGLRDDLAEISVADTGVGIAPEDQEAVFEEFRQVGTADKKVEGTGLGLALARKFVELHGGRIWVRSQVGEGSTFTFTLPVRREEMGA